MMDNEIYDTAIIIFIISGYAFCALLWAMMGVIHIKWGTPNSFAGIGMSLAWVWYGYRNYMFFTNPFNKIDEMSAWYNLFGVLFVCVVTYYMACTYFKHVINFVKRLFV